MLAISWEASDCSDEYVIFKPVMNCLVPVSEHFIEFLVYFYFMDPNTQVFIKLRVIYLKLILTLNLCLLFSS